MHRIIKKILGEWKQQAKEEVHPTKQNNTLAIVETWYWLKDKWVDQSNRIEILQVNWCVTAEQ